MVRWLVLFLFVTVSSIVVAQQQYKLQLTAIDTSGSFFANNKQSTQTFKDTLSVQKALSKMLNKLKADGYWAASVDTLMCDSGNCVAAIYVGKKLEAFYINTSNIDPVFQREQVLKSINPKKPVAVKEVEKIKLRLLTVAENKGYPFAEVYLNSFDINLNTAQLLIDKHELFVFDSIELVDKTRIKPKFLSAYLGIKRGKPYDESKVKAVAQRLNTLQFVEQTQSHSVLFDKEKAKLQLYLRNKKASAFNFFLGVLPGGAGQKVLITGEAKLHLFSPLGFGEQFNIEWNKTLPKTQVLKAMLAFPYLFGLPLGVDVRFELFKRDTSWLDIDREFGLRYQFSGMNFIRAALKQKTTIVLKADTNFVKNFRRLPNALDINTNEFSLDYYYMNLDYRFNPTRGWQVNVGGAAGEKRIKRNSLINDLKDESQGGTFAYLYDSIGTRTYQLQFFLSVEKYWRLTKRMTVLTGLKGKYFFSPILLENEKFRLGGLGSLRGFTEESIITPYYGMMNLEYRYLLSKNAFFFAFFNGAVVANNFTKSRIDFPFGFGAGVTLETKAGIFGVTYALGQKADTKLAFRNSKIHFGYINYF